MKRNCKLTFYAKKTLLTLVIFAVTFSNVGFVYAAEGETGVLERVFAFKEKVFTRVEEMIPEIDITKTATNLITTLTTDWLLGLIWQRNGDELGACAIYLAQDKMGGTEAVVSALDCMGLDDASAHVEQAVADANLMIGVDDTVCDFDTVSVASRNGGSMASVATSLYHTVQEPPPVNLAMYFRDYARRIPVVKDTAFAQSRYSYVLGETLILDIWKKTRNVAYGIMSVALLVVGMMIMTRKKISPQVMVTVQSALPRIIISLVLITFSFPIGAVITSLTIPLMSIVIHVFFAEMVNDMIHMEFLPMMFTFLFVALGAGTFLMIMLILVFLLTILLLIAALFRVLIVYFQLLAGIILAPIQFSLGAIPGMEGSTTKWFKNMIAKLLSVPAMFFMIAFAWYLPFKAFLGQNVLLCDPSSTSDPLSYISTVGRNVSSVQSSIFLVPLFMIFLLAASMKVPKMIQNAIVGEKRR